MDPNPVVWLASRERRQSLGVWILAVLVIVPFIAVLVTVPSMAWIIWSQVRRLLMFALYLWTASQAARFFIEARKSGLTELLLVTPLDSRNVVLGQWHALLRTFGLPLVLLLVMDLAGTVFSQHTSMTMISGAVGGYTPSVVFNVFLALIGVLSDIANLIALVWFSMWMGLTSRNVGLATLKSIIFVQVLPWLGITFASTSLMGVLMFRGFVKTGAPANSMVFTFPFLMTGSSALLTLAKDAAFFAWARQKLYCSFRAVAATPSLTAPSTPQLPPGLPTDPLPPIIAAPR
jgi:hypothetical protein